MTERCSAPPHNQPTVRRTREAGNSALDLTCILDVHWCQLHSQGRCHSLSGSEQAKPLRDRGVAEYGRSSKMGASSLSSSSHFAPLCRREGAKGDPAAQIAKLGAHEASDGAIIFRSGSKLYVVDAKPPQ